MAGFIHCVRFRTPTGYLTSGAGAADSSFPHANAADIVHPHRPWKSSGSVSIGSTYYGVDFGAAVQLAAVAIDNTNVQTVTLEAADDTAFSTNLIQQAVIIGENQVERSLFTTSQGITLGRSKAFINLDGTDFDSAARRYWRIVAGAASVDSDEPKFFIGSVAWCRAITTWSSGTSSYEETPIEATRPNDDFAGGGAEPVILGNGTSSVALGAAPGERATMRASVLELLREGIGRPFLFYKNDGDTADFYICHRSSDVTIKQTSPNTIEFQQLIMRNAV